MARSCLTAPGAGPGACGGPDAAPASGLPARRGYCAAARPRPWRGTALGPLASRESRRGQMTALMIYPHGRSSLAAAGCQKHANRTGLPPWLEVSVHQPRDLVTRHLWRGDAGKVEGENSQRRGGGGVDEKVKLHLPHPNPPNLL